MREAFLKYIAANGNIVGQALCLPTMSQASDALTLQRQTREQITQRILWPI
jgi:hypothetical protein